jgi:hypothetical protein
MSLRIEGLKRFSVETCFIFSSFPYCNLNKHLHILQWLLGSSFAFRVGGLPRFGFASFVFTRGFCECFWKTC